MRGALPPPSSSRRDAPLPVSELVAVHRHFPSAGVHALSDVNLRVPRGHRVAVVGPSGSGKSTLLHLLSGLDRPTSGVVLFEGRAVGSRREWTAIRARRIGFVFQSFHLFPTLSARENVEVPMAGSGRSARDVRRHAEELLDAVGLADRRRHRPGELSGGECQRVAIARSLANEPDLILADEPTGNLDRDSSAGVLALLDRLQRERGLTVVVVTHSPDVAAGSDSVIRLVKGVVVGGPTGAEP